jgi:hypothetical protein
MSHCIAQPKDQLIVPTPRLPVSVRVAMAADLPFIDSLQKQHAKQVGWMPTKQLEGKVRMGHVIVAEERHEAEEGACHPERSEGSGSSPDERARSFGVPQDDNGAVPRDDNAAVPRDDNAARPILSSPLGYCIGNDQYFKRDDVGIIYQMNVVPGRRRSLVGATLVKAMFERAAYGCKLFCCWCAQDIEANRFWESLGFVPLAYRAGSREKGRVHIFWQRRIRAGDATTPYWFPSQTTSGSIREDRLVLPIPPGTHWSEAMPVVLPREQPAAGGGELPGRRPRKPIAKKPPTRPRLGAVMWFAPPTPAVETPKREPRQKVKNDPKLIAAARELRDRWLEQVNADPSVLLSNGKYDVTRPLLRASQATPPTPLLTAA